MYRLLLNISPKILNFIWAFLKKNIQQNIYVFQICFLYACMLVCIACMPRRLKGDRGVIHSYFFFSFQMFFFWVRHFLKLSDTGSVGNCSMSEAQFESDNLHLWGKARKKNVNGNMQSGSPWNSRQTWSKYICNI